MSLVRRPVCKVSAKGLRNGTQDAIMLMFKWICVYKVGMKRSYAGSSVGEASCIEARRSTISGMTLARVSDIFLEKIAVGDAELPKIHHLTRLPLTELGFCGQGSMVTTLYIEYIVKV